MAEDEGDRRAASRGTAARGASAPPTGAAASAAGALLAGLLCLAPTLAAPQEGPPAAPAAGQPAPGPCGHEDAAVPFPAPLASPLEPHTRLAPVHVSRGDRERWVALADLGEQIPFWIARGCGSGEPALAAAVAGGAFSRFDLEGRGNELVEAHFRAGVRLRARLRGVEARLEAYHVSSHLGDEFLERTGRSPVSTSREGLELLVQAAPLPGLRLYGGPGLLVRSTRGLDPLSVRAGAEWRELPLRWGPFVPYVSVEAFGWEELGWDPLLAGEAGVSFGGGTFRLALTAGAGPSRAEQFFRDADETLWGLSFSVTR